MNKDGDKQRKKRRRSTRLLHRESLGLGDLKSLSISETHQCTEELDERVDCVQEMLHLETGQVDQSHFSLIQNDEQFIRMDITETNCASDGRKRQLSPLNTTADCVLPATECMGDVLTDQAQSANHLPSPPKLKKASECNQQTQQVILSQELSAEDIILPFDEPSQCVEKKQSMRRSRRRSSDCFILESNIISSPADEVIDLPMGIPRTRRSSRLRRKSIEIFKHQQDLMEETANSRADNVSGDNFDDATSKNGSSVNVDADSLEFTKLKIVGDEKPDHSSSVISFSEHNGDLVETALTEATSVEKELKKHPKRGRPLKSTRPEKTVDSFEVVHQNDDVVVPELKMCEVTGEMSLGEAPTKRAKRGKLAKSVVPEENLEEIYKNKNFVAPTLKMWETIFESPMAGKSQKLVSTKRFKRLIDFEDFQPQKYKLRRQKALKRGWKAPTKKKREAAEKFLQNKMLELEMDELGVVSSESSRSSSLSELPELPSQDLDRGGRDIFNETSRSSSSVSEPSQDMDRGDSELSDETPWSSSVGELSQDMDRDDSELSNETPRSSSVSEPSQDIVSVDREVVSDMTLERVSATQKTAKLSTAEQMDIGCDKVRAASREEDSVEGMAMCDMSPVSDLTPLSQEMETDVFTTTPALAPVNTAVTEPRETGEEIAGDVDREEFIAGSSLPSEILPDHMDQLCVMSAFDTSSVSSDGVGGKHGTCDVPSDRVDEECAEASDITCDRVDRRKCALTGSSSDKIDCGQDYVNDGMDRDSVSTEISSDNDSSVEHVTSDDGCSRLHAQVNQDLDESVKSNISDDSFQDFGNMTFDSSKEFPELLYDDTGNESALDTAIYLNTPPDSRESNCSIECSTRTLLQASMNMSNGSDKSMLDDSLVSGSADVMNCR